MLLDGIWWTFVLGVSLFALMRGARYLVHNGEHIGLAKGISPFIAGVVIIGIGTSIPELVAALVAMSQGVTEFIPANAVGSNIVNILLILGLTGVITRNFFVQKNLIYLDLPLLVIATILFLFVAADTVVLPDGTDGLVITRGESIFLLITYLLYLGYSFSFSGNYTDKIKTLVERPKANWKNYALMIGGLIGVILGAKYVVDATINLAAITGFGVGVISIFAIALGTSLPELSVSIQAVRAKKPELAFGNILGSNLFNMLVLIGLPGLFKDIHVDGITTTVGFPFLIAATLVLVISGISNKVHLWDGSMYLMLYVLFVAKLFGLF